LSFFLFYLFVLPFKVQSSLMGANFRQEIGMMRAQLETTKFQIIQWLFGVVTGAGALGLGNSSLFPAFVSFL
jgi:hypothetical protein